MKFISRFLLIIALLVVTVYAPVQVSAGNYTTDKAKDCAEVFEADGTTVIPQNKMGALNAYPACSTIQTNELGFKIPSLGDILTFAIRAFFVIAGLSALFYLLLGAFGWVTSGGDKDSITAAREKIQAAVLGMILIVAVLAIIWTLEQVIFKRRICLGLSCPLTLPGLIERTDGDYCCVCINEDTNTLTTLINTSSYKCLPDGTAEAL